ncbi:MAG: bifunctional metallophosphatase/5'-nucleotidase, partial [Lachnospiraceae bacterium]|nr:bifunctional metallophosphatase/5'-nucleotidase [Lachnospiraceae bacterium]
MGKKFRKLGLLLAAVLLFSMFGLTAAAEENAKTLDVLFVHDTHSHLNEFATVEDGESQIMGGFAKIKTLINEKKAENPDTLVLDAGDFSMGTLIQVVFEEEAS